jgi:hypothetical protein
MKISKHLFRRTSAIIHAWIRTTTQCFDSRRHHLRELSIQGWPSRCNARRKDGVTSAAKLIAFPSQYPPFTPRASRFRFTQFWKRCLCLSSCLSDVGGPQEYQCSTSTSPATHRTHEKHHTRLDPVTFTYAYSSHDGGGRHAKTTLRFPSGYTFRHG